MEFNPAPHKGPIEVTTDVVLTAVEFVGVNPAVKFQIAFGIKVVGSTPSVVTVNAPFAGGATVNAALAFPTLTRLNATLGAATPISDEGKAIIVGDPGAKLSVAPDGVALSGIATELFFGSFVNRFSVPVTATPAVADAGTFAEIVSVRVPPSPIESAVGVTENADPVVVAVTASGTDPAPAIVNDLVPT
jgi:hypothetical protein